MLLLILLFSLEKCLSWLCVSFEISVNFAKNEISLKVETGGAMLSLHAFSTALAAPAPVSSMGIQRRRVGNSDLVVSECCLGGMTWGGQNTPEEASGQLSFAFDCGVNFVDTAEVGRRASERG